MSDNSDSSRGALVLGLMGGVLIVLKLTGVISWSWWWVTSLFWGGSAFAAVIVGSAFSLGITAAVLFKMPRLLVPEKRVELDAPQIEDPPPRRAPWTKDTPPFCDPPDRWGN